MGKNKIKITDPSRILTLANMISLFRAFLAIPIIYTLQYDSLKLLTFLLIMLGVISDMLDGYFARRAEEVTHFGKWIDPIADFICLTSVTYFLVLNDRFPMLFFILYVFRYVTIALLAVYLMNSSGFILSSNWYGKWAGGFTLITILLHIFPSIYFDWLVPITLIIASFLMLISWFLYVKSMVRNILKI